MFAALQFLFSPRAKIEHMAIRPYTVDDHEQVAAWWVAQGFPVIAPDMLPATGMIIPGRCAGFLYKTDSPFALLEWVVANPAVGPTERSAALDQLITALVDRAKTLGFGVVFTSVTHPRLTARYERLGFLQTDVGATNMIKRLT